MTDAFPPVSELPVQPGLANPFERIDGSRVSRVEDWAAHREYLAEMLEHYLYGPLPAKLPAIEWETRARGEALDGRANTEHAAVTLERRGESTTVHVGLLWPGRPGRFPVVIKNDNFLLGRHDPDGSDVEAGTPKNDERVAQQAFADEQAVERGYAVCTFLREDVARDTGGKRDRGVFPLYPEHEEWGVIGAWAWAYGVLIDALEERSFVRPDSFVATGHSRGGKTALCAGIYDDRIAVTAPNSSGTGGTGSWRFFDDEHDPQTLAYHDENYRHWWSPRIMEFVGREDHMPFDAHTAKAAIAPRRLINTHAREDWWANPYGTALTTLAAQPVFDWLGVPDSNAQHWRDGGHDQTETDWLALFDFCDRYFGDERVDREFQVNPHPDRYTFDEDRFASPPDS